MSGVPGCQPCCPIKQLAKSLRTKLFPPVHMEPAAAPHQEGGRGGTRKKGGVRSLSLSKDDSLEADTVQEVSKCA